MTSCLYGFYKDGTYKVTYHHCDSYPSGFGRDVAAFIRENSMEELNTLWDTMKSTDCKSFPTKEEVLEIESHGLHCHDCGELLKWGDIDPYNGGYLEYYTSYNFMCDYRAWLGKTDWIYIIDLDRGRFLTYDHRPDRPDTGDWEQQYRIRADHPLDSIPKDWYKEL